MERQTYSLALKNKTRTQDDEPAGNAPLEDVMRACAEQLALRRHLADIRREHGVDRRWPTVATPVGRALRLTIPPPPHSAIGSAAALCAAEGDIAP